MSMNEYIPADFSPLADWDHRNRAHKDGHSAEWKTLSDAVKSGEIPGFKLGNGRWYVHAAKANEFLAKSKAAPVKAATKASDMGGIDKRHAESLCLSLADIGTTLVEVRCVMERLTAAVESIATQPNVRFEDATEASWNGTHGNTN